MQRATLQENGGADAGTIMYTEALDIKYPTGVHVRRQR
jgi:hypothetical protein